HKAFPRVESPQVSITINGFNREAVKSTLVLMIALHPGSATQTSNKKYRSIQPPKKGRCVPKPKFRRVSRT
ncbi:MAG: hypothetical protein ACXW50_19430, partial [Candidatus Binatia bacterium]